MVNPFLSSKMYDTETAIMLERAYVHDIGNAVAYTDGDKIFINTPDNLFKILPAYNDNMLKWLLWHERIHMELKHHNRFFKYLSELSEEDTEDEFHVTKEEVNIIMDILVHDWMSDKFPELIETAKANLAQFRDRNSLKYTFKTATLEEMLDEYAKHKRGDDEEKDKRKEPSDSEDDDKEEDDKTADSGDPSTPKKKKKDDKKKETPKSKGHEKEEHKDDHGTNPEEGEEESPDVNPDAEQPDPGHHDEADWSKLDDIDGKEFITEHEADCYIDEINRIKRTKIKLARITETLNGLVTTTKIRSYKTPSYMITGQHTIFKGSKNGKASLYLCFDASGSMSGDMDTFKEIIGKAIPQALKTPTVWFSGYAYSPEGREAMERCHDKEGRNYDYYKGTFHDFMNISADSGYNDDGDRTIEMCWKAEQKGYSPIGVTDGGGQISWSISMLKELQRTVFVGHSKRWLEKAQEINPRIQIIYTGRESD